MKRRQSVTQRIEAQLQMQSRLVAALALQRGVPASEIKRLSGVELPDPWLVLLPYVRASLALQLRIIELAHIPDSEEVKP